MNHHTSVCKLSAGLEGGGGSGNGPARNRPQGKTFFFSTVAPNVVRIWKIHRYRRPGAKRSRALPESDAWDC